MASKIWSLEERISADKAALLFSWESLDEVCTEKSADEKKKALNKTTAPLITFHELDQRVIEGPRGLSCKGLDGRGDLFKQVDEERVARICRVRAGFRTGFLLQMAHSQSGELFYLAKQP